MVRIYMFTVCLVLLLGMSTCVPVWAATPSASYDYDAATHYDHSLDSDCQSTPPGCSYVALEHKTDCVHSESRTNNTGLFGILCWSSIIVVGYLSVSRDYDTPSNKFNNSPHRPNYDVRIEPRCTSTTTLKNDMSQYRAYFVPGAMDPTGTEVAGWHHPYPCHLGGHYSTQPLFYLDEAARTAHAYFRGLGIQYGDAGRLLWSTFSKQEQVLHIKNSMRAAGIGDDIVNLLIADILDGATPGVLVRRRGPRGFRFPVGKIFGFSLGVGVVADVVLSPSALADATPPHRFGDEDCKETKACNCTEEVHVTAERNWSNPRLDIISYDWRAQQKGYYRTDIARLANAENQKTGKILDCQNQPIKMTPSVCRSHDGQTTKQSTWDAGDGFTYTRRYYLSCEPVEN